MNVMENKNLNRISIAAMIVLILYLSIVGAIRIYEYKDNMDLKKEVLELTIQKLKL